MLKLRELLRLKWDGKLGHRAIGRAINVSPSTVSYYSRAFQASGLSWPVPGSWDDEQLKNRLEPYCYQLKGSYGHKAAIDFTWLHQELKTKGVTLQLLWQEYQQSQASKPTYSYSEFCRQYRSFRKRLKPSLRQSYHYGEKCRVDYAGPKVPIVNAEDGSSTQACIFVGVLCASNLTYAEATLSRGMADWLGAHTRMLQFFGGVPALLIPDNEKAAVHQACYYDPELNPQYAAWARHYQITVLPARPYQPRDKAKVETAVQIVERFILAKLRHHQFFSLKELNEQIKKLLTELNHKPFKQLPGSRNSQFQQHEQAKLKPRPQCDYELADMGACQVGLDYHIKVNRHFYSVPHQLISQKVQYRLTTNSLYVYHQGKLMAQHIRSDKMGGHTTCTQHQSKAHQAHLGWSKADFLQWGQAIGPYSTQIAQYHIDTQPHPECCYRIHLGFKRLCQRFGPERLEQVCRYALQHQAYSHRSIRSILQQQMEQQTLEQDETFTPTEHSHVRGKDYYTTQKEITP